jgi:hypothetical protein
VANTKVEILGGQLDGTILQNAASEATLRELVNAINGMTGKKTGPAGSGGAGGGGGLFGGGLKKQQEELEKQTSSLGKMFKGAGTALGQLTGGMVSGKMKMADMVGVLTEFGSTFPVVGGIIKVFGGVVTTAISNMQEWNEQLKIANVSGAAFSNNLFELKLAATRSYMELDEFVSMVAENRKELIGLGGTVTAGAKAFSELAEEVNKSGGVGQTLTDMGWSTQRINTAMLKYAASTGMGIKNINSLGEGAVR